MKKRVAVLAGGLCLSICVAGTAVAENDSRIKDCESVAYGICAHLTGDEHSELVRSLRMMSAAGVEAVRTDFFWRDCDAGEGKFDFARFDSVVAEAERFGIVISPVIGAPPDRLGGRKCYPDSILDAWTAYVGAVAEHYKGRVSGYEIVNEADGVPSFKDPAVYARFLKRAAAAIRQADPTAKVLSSGLIGIPYDWIRGLYEAGARDDFDVLSIHPYTHPNPPESMVDRLTQLRSLMAEHGDGNKPICINEIGWPTHRIGIGTHTSAFLDLALRMFFKAGQPVRAAYADMATEDAAPQTAVADEILRQLPTGSSARCLSPARLTAALSAGEIDIVVVLGEDYSPRVIDPLAAFMAKGGVVVHGNAMPFCYPRERTASGILQNIPSDAENDRRKLRLCESAGWLDESYMPAKAGMMTDEARRLGFKGDLGKYPARLFVEGTCLKPEDRFVRIIGGTTDTGKEFTQGAIYDFDSDWKGAFVVSALDEGCMTLGGDAMVFQAMCLSRGLGIVTAMGIAGCYPYEFRSPGGSVYYSEHNFGLLHANFAPKPAWSAYTTFVDARPVGSENLERKWRNEKGTVFCPCWRRPDGKTAGMIWRTDRNEMSTLSFTADAEISFCDHLGAQLNPLEVSKGQFRLEIGPCPVFFKGGVPVLR